MRFAPALREARLERRYKRFLADVITPDGERMTIHCPNTGAMLDCADPGARIWYSTSDRPGRKYPHTWEIVESARGHLIGVHTGRANGVIAEALDARRIPELASFANIRAEVRLGASRIDFLLENDDGRRCAVEVKSVTLGEADGRGSFPDARSERARRHLDELISLVEAGEQAVLLYCVQHTGIESVAPADHIDPEYGQALRRAMDAGVQVLAWRVAVSPDELVLDRPLPVLRGAPAGA